MFLLRIKQKLSFLGKRQRSLLVLLVIFLFTLPVALYLIFRNTGLFSWAGRSNLPISLVTNTGKHVWISADQNGNANVNRVMEGDTVTLTITGDNQPEGLGDIKFFVMKKTAPTSGRPEKFGVSGAHGEWDLMPGLYRMYNAIWGSNKTGDQMLERHYAMLSAMGIKWIRIDQSWERVEPKQGEYDFGYMDRIMAAAKRNNLQVMMSLSYIPQWMYKNCIITTKHTQSPIDANEWGSILYNKFVTQVVSRYKPNGTFDPASGYGIRYWQIWNEPDIGFWTDCQTGQSGGIQPKYAALLKSAYQTIKSVDPQAKVISGGITHLNPTTVLQGLYNLLGQNKTFDIIDVHNYETADVFASKVTNLAKTRNNNQDSGKEIWLSETSAGAMPGTYNDNGQGDYMRAVWGKFEALSPNLNLGKAFWWGTRGYVFDSKPEGKMRGENTNGLFENTFYPKKIYFDMGEWLGTIKYKGEVPAKAVSSNRNIEVTIPREMLTESGEYKIFYASPTKIVTALPVTLYVDPSPIPNCGNLVGETNIRVGKKAKYTASFYSPQANLGAQIVAVKDGTTNYAWEVAVKKIPGNYGEVSYQWKPTEEGNYTVFCRAWNDGIAECRGLASFVDGPPRYLCAGPSTSLRVTVTKNSTQSSNFLRGRRRDTETNTVPYNNTRVINREEQRRR